MNILELARECGACTMTEAGESVPYHISFGPEELQTFYDAAFQAGRDSMQLEMSQQELALRPLPLQTNKEGS